MTAADPGDPPYLHQHTRMELDSHADTCALGGICLILQETGRTVHVEAFDDTVVQDVPIVTAAVAYDCPATFHTYILIFHEAFYVQDMTTHLLNPFQLRNQGIIVNEVPLQHIEPEKRDPQCHSIISEDPPMHIPLTLNGVMSGFTVRMPTWDEVRDVEQHNVFHVHMTASEEWTPHTDQYSHIEGTLHQTVTRGMTFHDKENRDISHLQVRGQTTVDDLDLEGTTDGVFSYDSQSLKTMQREQSHTTALDVDRYAQAMMEELGIKDADLEELGRKLANATTIRKRPGFVDAEQLSKNWKIGDRKSTCLNSSHLA